MVTIDMTQPKDKRILQAAEEVFSRHGYEKATLDEIIALADVGKGTVYKYFGNKEQAGGRQKCAVRGTLGGGCDWRFQL